jgi:hypothetical protein
VVGAFFLSDPVSALTIGIRKKWDDIKENNQLFLWYHDMCQNHFVAENQSSDWGTHKIHGRSKY